MLHVGYIAATPSMYLGLVCCISLSSVVMALTTLIVYWVVSAAEKMTKQRYFGRTPPSSGEHFLVLTGCFHNVTIRVTFFTCATEWACMFMSPLRNRRITLIIVL